MKRRGKIVPGKLMYAQLDHFSLWDAKSNSICFKLHVLINEICRNSLVKLYEVLSI